MRNYLRFVLAFAAVAGVCSIPGEILRRLFTRGEHGRLAVSPSHR